MQKLLPKEQFIYASFLVTPIRSYLWLSMGVDAKTQQLEGKMPAATFKR